MDALDRSYYNEVIRSVKILLLLIAIIVFSIDLLFIYFLIFRVG